LVVANGNVEIAELLINKGASIDAVIGNNKTPLHWAVHKKNMEICSRIFNQKRSIC
jgi:ankyrin repeat protein